MHAYAYANAMQLWTKHLRCYSDVTSRPQGLTGLIGYSYQQVATSFPEVHLERTPKLSVLGLERWVTDRKILPGCARVRTKCTEKTCAGL
jgi:hypothetical protein